jgi:hypothetical protein
MVIEFLDESINTVLTSVISSSVAIFLPKILDKKKY